MRRLALLKKDKQRKRVTRVMDASEPNPQKLEGYEFFNQVLKSPKHILAPMVDGSDLCYRLLARRYGAHLTYTPMLFSRLFVASKKYRREALQPVPTDRPLIAQFCSTSPQELLQAALLAQDHCDAIDINLGCPQKCAMEGGYGAFLAENQELVFSMVKLLHKNLRIPVCCKIRIWTDYEKTINFAVGLQESGCQMLVVHGRTKEQKKALTGAPDWEIIRQIKEKLTIPVISNGGIQNFEDIDKCLQYTGCDGVMSAEAVLHNPAFFANIIPCPCSLAIEYLELCQQYPTKSVFINAHIYEKEFTAAPEFRAEYSKSISRASKEKNMVYLIDVIQRLKQALAERELQVES